MLGWGQPLHAFDAGKIGGGTLIARRARDGEESSLLDGVRRRLDDEMLVIADVEKPLVIAGVFGAVDAEVDAHTRDSCSRRPTSAARTSSAPRCTRHPQRGEQPLREGSRPAQRARRPRLRLPPVRRAVRRRSGAGVVDVHGELPSRRPLSYRPAKGEALLGYAVPRGRAGRHPARLECDVERGRSRRCDTVGLDGHGARRSVPTSSARSTSSRRSDASPATGGRPRRCRATPRRAA